MKNEDMPWTSNYPPLRTFLDKHEARCMWQVRVGGTSSNPNAFVEMWQFPNGKQAIILVHARKHGWDIFTPSGHLGIDASIADAERRMELP